MDDRDPGPAEVDHGRRPLLGGLGPWHVGLLVSLPVLGLYLIGADRGLGYDSSVTVGAFVATDDLWTPFRHQIVFNNHPLFSFAEHLVYSAGGRSELALAVLPAACGAAGAGVLAGWLSTRTTAEAGLTAGVLLAANPVYAEVSRNVRGYTLMTLCVIVATIIVLEGTRGRRGRLLGAAYVLCMALAVGTHLYAGLALVVHGVLVLARAEISLVWTARWAGASVLGLLPYRQIAEGMLVQARGRPKVFHPAFPEQTVRMALGNEWPAVLALLPLAAVGCWRFRRSRAAWAVTAAVVLVLGGLWLVLKPVDLYPRFLIPLAAAAAAAIAFSLPSVPRVVAVACVGGALAVMVATDVTRWHDDDGIRAAAGIARQATAQGLDACVGYFYGEAFLGYGDRPRPVTQPAELAGCDVLFLGRDVGELFEPAADEYPYRRTDGLLTAYSRDRALLDAPPGTIPR